MKTTMNISIDPKIKKEFTELAKDMGTNPTNLLNMFIIDTINKRKVSLSQNNFEIESFSDEEINNFGTDFLEKTEKLTKKAKNILKDKFLQGKL